MKTSDFHVLVVYVSLPPHSRSTISNGTKRESNGRISPPEGASRPPPPNSSERIYLSRFRRATRVSAQRDRARPWPQLVWVIQSRFGPLNPLYVPTPRWKGAVSWLVRAVIVVSDLQLENAMNPQVRVCSPVPTRRRPSGSTGLIYYTRRSRLAQLVPGLSLSPVLRELLIRQVPSAWLFSVSQKRARRPVLTTASTMQQWDCYYFYSTLSTSVYLNFVCVYKLQEWLYCRTAASLKCLNQAITANRLSI